ncbi:MAG: glycosyltransferase, partial [Spirochaetia bacterium]|nr:glycosyltransferase [Spirochaetia bacterium]
MLKIGVRSELLVQYAHTSAPHVSSVFSSRIRGVLKAYFDQIPLRFYGRRKPSAWSPSWISSPLSGWVQKINPDMIHLHWIWAGLLSTEAIARLKRPFLWTLHDSGAFTGGCHIPGECQGYQKTCGNCPQLDSRFGFDLSRVNHWRKRRAWHDIQWRLVTPSRWLKDKALSSSLFAGADIRVIPNPLDLSLFKPAPKIPARKILNLPPGKKLILFGAFGNHTDRNKGSDLLLEAMGHIKSGGNRHRPELIILGDAGLPTLPGWKVHSLGMLKDQASLILAYSAADLCVVPSRQEAFGLMAAEALACGTPVVSFAATGLLEIVLHKKNVFTAEPYYALDLAGCMEWFLSNSTRPRLP